MSGMSFALAREIYGITPWMMDVHSIPVMSSVLRDIKNGVTLDTPEFKLNSVFFYDPKNETRIIKDKWDLRNNDNFDGIGIINLNGPITVSGGSSSRGMDYVSETMLQMNKDNRIKSFIVLTNSGGGSSGAVELMVDTINEVKQTKPVYALITKGGMAASAAYGIISSATKIYSESGMNVVGSIGTMLQFEGKKANSKDSDGTINIRLYATKSIKKNEGFEEALNNDNYDILINKLLDPINENFISMILGNRPSVESIDFSDGATHFSKDVIGTFIDGIASFSEVVGMLEKEQTEFTNTNEFNINNTNNKKMTKNEFKTAQPDAYNEILQEGVAQEADRTGAYLAHINTDPDEVVKGIQSGKPLSQSQREAFFVKQNSKKVIENLKQESAEDISTDESLTDVQKIAQKAKETEAKAAFGFELK